MCGETPSVEQPLTESVQGIDIRDVMRLFHLPMQACECYPGLSQSFPRLLLTTEVSPVTHGVCNLARDASEQLIGSEFSLAFTPSHLPIW